MNDGIFSGGIENVIRWISVAGALVTCVGIALLLRFLLASAEWRASTHGRWTLLAGMLVLPGISLVLGNSVGYHHANSSSCFECHVMEPWVRDLKDPASPTLAARHWRNRWIHQQPCYTCHAGYGVGGTLANKLSGVMHVWRTHVTHPPDPIVHAGPYPLETCLSCHAPTPKFRDSPGHRMTVELWEKVSSAQLSCFDCHGPPHPRAGEAPVTSPYRADRCLHCHGAHEPYLQAPAHTLSPTLQGEIGSGALACDTCHTLDPQAPNHHARPGRHPDTLCLRCHRESPKFLESPSHADDMVKEFILSGELACRECHADAHAETPK